MNAFQLSEIESVKFISVVVEYEISFEKSVRRKFKLQINGWEMKLTN